MKHVNPINYKIRIEPDLSRFNYKGHVEILMEAEKPVRHILLNLLDLVVWSCKLKSENSVLKCPFLIDPKEEEIKVSLPQKMTGRIVLEIAYMAEINNKMVGFYRSMYLLDGEEKYVAITQFEENDARRAFPCFDHPVKKATFDIEIIVNEKLTALSNALTAEEKDLGNGKKLVRFHQTPVMSTYLLFFGVGEFELIEDKGEILVRAATMRGMSDYAEFGLQFARKCLEFAEDYYGISYPFPKLDLIAVSDFAAGAMENWGAITFRENLLLHYPDSTSKAGKERICEVIAHEIAHQWFGNLVSPSEWKYLWLNESFATFFGYGIVSYYYPEWDIWDNFLHNQTNIALNRDSLHETFSIEIPGEEHVVINAGTAPIIYNKGGSILRLIEGYVGKECFKESLRYYLKKHAYDCASSHHLWEALEEVSEQPVSEIMKNWVEQPGYPIIEAEKKGNELFLSQKRFTFLPNESEQKWLIPLNIRTFFKNGDFRDLTILFDTKNIVLDLGSDVLSYKVNYGQTGFFRIKYLDKQNLMELGKQTAQKLLPPEDRWGLQNDLYAFVKSCEVSIDDYLDFLFYYSDEHAFLPLTSIADNLFHAYLVMEEKCRENISKAGKLLFEKVLSDIGLEPRNGEKHTISLLRNQLIRHAALYGSKEVSEFSEEQFSALMRGEKIHPDIMKSVFQNGAMNGDKEIFEWLERKFASSENEHERINILAAFGSLTDKALIKQAQQIVLDKIPSRNKFIPLEHMASNLAAIPGMWQWYVSHLDEIEQFHPVHYERVVAAIVPLCGLGKEEQVRRFFKDYMVKKKKAEDVIKLSLERLKINSRMRQS